MAHVTRCKTKLGCVNVQIRSFFCEGKWHSHIPYYSKLIRSEDDEEEWSLDFRKAEKKSKAWLVDYPLKTKPGISGGAVIVNDGTDEMVIGNRDYPIIFVQIKDH